MQDSQILSIITEELSNSIGGTGSTITEDRKKALRYYLGSEPAPPPTDEKLSGVVSTDVADAVEWIMPEIVKAFTQTNEVVSFDPVADGDEDQADLETDYVYGVIMKENDGFTAIHTLIKDCLLQKNGIIKVYYDDTQDVSAESYTGLSKEQLQMLVSSPEVEIMNMTGTANVLSLPQDPSAPNPPKELPLEQAEQLVKLATEAAQKQIQPIQQKMQKMQQVAQKLQQAAQQNPQAAQQAQQDPKIMQMGQHVQQQMQQSQQQIQQIMQQVPKIVEVCIDVKIRRTKDKGKVTVVPVPPEEFRISSRHNSVNPKEAPFTGHCTTKTRGELLEKYPNSKEDIDAIECSTSMSDDDESYRYYEQDEHDNESSTSDKSQDDIDVFEVYLTIDVDDDGIGKLMQIVSIGSDDVPAYILEKSEVTENPFVAATAIMMSHKFLGLSFYDRLKEIQDEKTWLWRSMNDNLALINNKQYEVVEGKVNLDDMMVSRPGGITRVKAPGMLREIITSPLPPDSYKLFEYLDIVRAGRSGVSPEGSGQNHMVGAETAHGLERLMSKKEELTGLVVRVIAEAIKALVIRTRDLLIRNAGMASSHKFRGQWKQIDPSRWQERSMVTVRVGTGTGSQDRQVAALTKLGEAQMMIKQDPAQALVNESKVFKLLDDLSKAAGLTGAREYIVDPDSPEGQQQKQLVQQQQQQAEQKQNEIDKAFAQSQMELAKAEQMKAQADLQNVKVKAESEKMKADNEQLKAQLQQQKQDADAELTHQGQMSDIQEATGKQELDAVKIELDAMKGEGELEQKYAELQFKYDQLQAQMKLERDKLDSQEQQAAFNAANQSNESDKGREHDESMAKQQDVGKGNKNA